MEKGDKAYIVGLEKRTDLNREEVTLLEWKESDGRWAARCKTGECVKVKPTNLKAIVPLDPVLSESLTSIVCDSETLPVPKMELVGTGQISRMSIKAFVALALELYENSPPEDFMTAMFIEHIGKFGDCRLVYSHLKRIVTKTTKLPYGIVLPNPFRSMYEMKTVESLMKLLVNLRRGTIAHLRSKQSLLRRFAGKHKGITICNKNPVHGAIGRMLGRDDPKSMSSKTIADELIHASMGGEVIVIGDAGIEKLEFNEILHRAYIKWLVDHVLPTLDTSDARKGTLGEWHRILAWESQLTAKVLVTPRGLILDVDDHYSIDSWLDGFVSVDLCKLEDIPGVDTDRRILRMFLFAEKAFQATITLVSKERENEAKRPQSDDDKAPKTETPVEHQDTLSTESNPGIEYSEGAKVVVANMQNDESLEGLPYCNGMQGRVVSVLADGEYLISFSNLGRHQVVSGNHLTPLPKVPRDQHFCAACGKKAKLLCERCGLTWYCSKACQRGHYEKHREASLFSRQEPPRSERDRRLKHKCSKTIVKVMYPQKTTVTLPF